MKYKAVLKGTMAIVMASTSFTYANFAHAADVKGPNQLITESRSLLFESAYRIDKELVAHSQSQSRTSYDSSSSSSSSSSGGKVINPYASIAGGVLGGVLGSIAGGALKFSPLGTAALGVAGAGIGAAVATGHGYQENSERSNPSNTSYHHESSSESNTYQIHKKSDTWALIVLDKEGYKKAAAAIHQAELHKNNSCVQQSMKFLDSVIDNYKTLDANQLETLASNIKRLQQIRLQESIKADQKNTLSPVVDNINQFMDQRIRMVRLNWQDYLINKNANCQTSTQSKEDLTRITQELFNKTKESSVILNTNSMEQVPTVTFKSLPYKRIIVPEQSNLQASQVRLMIQQVLTLKTLKDLGYIEFSKKMDRVDLTNLNKGYAQELREQAAKGTESVNLKILNYIQEMSTIIALVTGSWTIFNSNSGLANSPKRNEGSFAVAAMGTVTAGISSGAVASSVYINQEQSKRKEIKERASEETRKVSERIRQDKSFNASIDNNVMIVEGLYGLNDIPAYKKDRNAYIQSFKENFIASMTHNAMADKKEDVSLYLYMDYARFMLGRHISEQQFEDMTLILNFLSQSQLLIPSANAATLQREKAEALLKVVTAVAQEAQDSSQMEQLDSMTQRLKREIQVLDLINK